MERGSRPRGSRAGNKLKLKPQTENSENGKKENTDVYCYFNDL